MFKKFVLALLLTAGIGCSFFNPPPNPPVDPPRIDMVVNVLDSESRFYGVEGVNVTCNSAFVGMTNPDGLLTVNNVLVGILQKCDFEKPGFFPVSGELAPRAGDSLLRVYMEREPPPHPNAPHGKLRIGGSCFVDDSGCVTPVYAHCGNCFSHYVRDPDRVLRELDDVMYAGYRGIRVWAVLGGRYWEGREVGPTVTEGYWGKVESFLNELRARNLYAVWSMGDIGQLGITREAYMMNLANIENRVKAIEWLDCGNEAWQTGEPRPEALARCVTYYWNSSGRALLTLTSPPGEESSELNRYSISPADAFDVHGFRDGHFWDKIRHIFSITYEDPPILRFGIQSEPWGNGDLVTVTANKHEIDDETSGLGAIMSTLSRQAWVWFSGEGVILQGAGLKGEAGFYNTARAVFSLVPKDVATYTTLHHSGTVFTTVRTFIPPTNDVRIDGRTDNDGRTVQVMYGPSGSYRVTMARTFTGNICNPGNLECHPIHWERGSTVDIFFTRGRVFIGRTE